MFAGIRQDRFERRYQWTIDDLPGKCSELPEFSWNTRDSGTGGGRLLMK